MDSRQLLRDTAIRLSKGLQDILEAKNPTLKLTQHPTIKKHIERMLDQIQAHHEKEITDPHINYFLTLVTRYNGLFLQVVDLEKTALPKEDERVIKHPLLGKASNTVYGYTITPSAKKKEYFREAVIAEFQGFDRYYYHKNLNTVTDNFVAVYEGMNSKIASPTQTSNATALFTFKKLSQKIHSFFRDKDLYTHDAEKTLFSNAWDKIQNGKELSVHEKKVFESGKHYRGTGTARTFSTKNEAQDYPETFSVGHATVLMDTNVPIGIDLVNFGCGAKTITPYPRHTQAGIPTEAYPLTPIILYTHNHYDHMDKETVQRAMHGMEPIFIVPVGDRKYLEGWGFKNIIEIETWNDEITIQTGNNPADSVSIHALPARHASGRSLEVNLFKPGKIARINTLESLYTGYIIREHGKNHVSIVTGDTAVLDDEHYQQIEQYLIDNDLTASLAFIAAGPDRPREFLECTHQSTADAMTYHARLNVANAKVVALRNAKAGIASNPLLELQNSACKGMGYHQGCFRLGVLNYNDVEGTFTRTLGAISEFPDNTPLAEILSNLSEQKLILDALRNNPNTDTTRLNNFAFALMDNFEREGLINTLTVYTALKNTNLTAKSLFDLIQSNTYLPLPGMHCNFNQEKTIKQHFKYDYQNLIVNRDPNHQQTRAYEEILTKMVDAAKKNPAITETLLTDPLDPKAAMIIILKAYLDKKSLSKDTPAKKRHVADAIAYLLSKDSSGNDIIKNDKAILTHALINLRGNIMKWETADTKQRNEGHFETVALIINGVLSNDDFLKTFREDLIRVMNPEKRSGLFLRS